MGGTLARCSAEGALTIVVTCTHGDLGEVRDPALGAAARLAEVIKRERPQVMLAYDATGGYGHPDHVKAHQVAVAAVEASGSARPARLYFVRFPLTWSREFVRALRQAGIDAPGSAVAGADAGPEVAAIACGHSSTSPGKTYRHPRATALSAICSLGSRRMTLKTKPCVRRAAATIRRMGSRPVPTRRWPT